MIGPIRSLLFVPGTRSDRFSKAMASGADAVAFDLEDSVEATQKEKARALIAEFLGQPASSAALRLVRFNAADTEVGRGDLDYFRDVSGYDGVLLPKVETPGILETVGRIFGSRALAGRPVPLMPLLESPRAILRAADIAAADAFVAALLFGAEDLTAQLAVPRTIDGDELIFPRAQVALAAAAVGAQAIDAVFTSLDDLTSLEINAAFTPSAAEIERARRVLDAYEAARAAGQGVTRMDNQMVELPIVERARRTLALAARYSGG
jgi:citrate lyase subunit beta/citryl-CoA lyase